MITPLLWGLLSQEESENTASEVKVFAFHSISELVKENMSGYCTISPLSAEIFKLSNASTQAAPHILRKTPGVKNECIQLIISRLKF